MWDWVCSVNHYKNNPYNLAADRTTKHKFMTLVETCWACQPAPSHRTSGGGIGSLPLATAETILLTCATDILLLYYTHHNQSSFITPVETCSAWQPAPGHTTRGGGGTEPAPQATTKDILTTLTAWGCTTHTPQRKQSFITPVETCWAAWPPTPGHTTRGGGGTEPAPQATTKASLTTLWLYHTHATKKAEFHYPCRDLLSGLAAHPWL